MHSIFSDFLSVLLYLAKINGKILNPADLPELPSSKLSQIASLKSPAGIIYQMATVAFDTLRRYKESMSVYLSGWVNRLDAANMLLAIQDTIRDSNTEYANIRIEKATQEVLLKNRYAQPEYAKFIWASPDILSGEHFEFSLDISL